MRTREEIDQELIEVNNSLIEKQAKLIKNKDELLSIAEKEKNYIHINWLIFTIIAVGIAAFTK